jgi:hypothetical protein
VWLGEVLSEERTSGVNFELYIKNVSHL